MSIERNGEHALELRIQERIAAWHLRIEDVVHTPSSVLAFGRRGIKPVVLKVIKRCDDEWLSGPVVEAFRGNGMAKALEHSDGAILLERLLPGTSLADSNEIGDDEAVAILAALINRMSPGPAPDGSPTVQQWGNGFEWYSSIETDAIPKALLRTAHRTYMELCASQTATRLLHGDLHHHNVLHDLQRGWLAIDPKGVVGELSFEPGAALRNPCGKPELYANPAVIGRRVDRFARQLRLEPNRILRWALAQAVLAAIWELQDDGALTMGMGWLDLARVIQTMLDGQLP